MNTTSFVYTTYIETTPEKLWTALIDSEYTKQYFFDCELVSDWQVGSSFKLMNKDKVNHHGEVLAYEPQSLLSFTWSVKDGEEMRNSKVTYELTPMNNAVKLSFRHEGLLEKDIRKDEGKLAGYNNVWPAVFSNLKSLLETGKALSAW